MSARAVRYLGVFCGLWAAAAAADFPQAVNDYNAGNYDVARGEFLRLAALGDAPSQFNLGAMATQAQGQPKDAGAAVGWADAANADYWKAGNAQWTAVKRGKELNWNTQWMEERLALYRKSRAWNGDLFALPPQATGSAASH